MKDYRINLAYTEMEESMERLVRNPTDAFSIIWFDVYDWLEPDNSAMKGDLCGILTEKVTGKNRSEVHTEVQNMTPHYQEIQVKYAFGKTIDELGDYWKELIREEKPFRLRLLLGCLRIYYEEIMPFIRNEMVAWWKEHIEPWHPEIAQTLKPYKEHRARVKATMQIIEIVLGIFALQNTNENSHEEM